MIEKKLAFGESKMGQKARKGVKKRHREREEGLGGVPWGLVILRARQPTEDFRCIEENHLLPLGLFWFFAMHHLMMSSLYIVIFNDFVPKLSPWYHCARTAPVQIDHFVMFIKNYRCTNAENKTQRIQKVDILRLCYLIVHLKCFPSHNHNHGLWRCPDRSLRTSASVTQLKAVAWALTSVFSSLVRTEEIVMFYVNIMDVHSVSEAQGLKFSTLDTSPLSLVFPKHEVNIRE